MSGTRAGKAPCDHLVFRDFVREDFRISLIGTEFFVLRDFTLFSKEEVNGDTMS